MVGNTWSTSKEKTWRRGWRGWRLPVSEAADFLIQACAGLAEAHASGIVHRDIKSSNLFVTRANDGTETIKVLDFGVSKFQRAQGDGHVLTSTGVAVDTPLYMSPEQVHGSEAIDARSDVWSLGVVLYELCVGKTPFYDESLGVTLLNVLERPHPTLRNSGVDLSPELERIVDACLAKDPEGRPASVATLAADLAPFATSEGKRLASRISAIGKRASARVQVALPRANVEEQETLRVEIPKLGLEDSGAAPSLAGTPAPGERTGTMLMERSRFTIPVAVGVAVVAIVSVVVATTLRGSSSTALALRECGQRPVWCGRGLTVIGTGILVADLVTHAKRAHSARSVPSFALGGAPLPGGGGAGAFTLQWKVD